MLPEALLQVAQVNAACTLGRICMLIESTLHVFVSILLGCIHAPELRQRCIFLLLQCT